jgi:hypothetical protein
MARAPTAMAQRSRFQAPRVIQDFATVQRALREVQEALDDATRSRAMLKVYTSDFTLVAGGFHRVSAGPGRDVKARLPAASGSNLSEPVTLHLESMQGTLTVFAAPGQTVNGGLTATFDVDGVVVLWSNGVNAWTGVAQLPAESPGGAALDAEYVLGAAHASLPNGAVATDTSSINVTVTPAGTATWAAIDGFFTWAYVLGNGNTSGANSPSINSGQKLIFAGGGAAGGDIDAAGVFVVDAVTSVGLTTAGVSRLVIEADGSWNIGGSNGTAGQYARSFGAAAPPQWSTILFSEVSGGTWSDVLAKGNTSGTNNPSINSGQHLAFAGGGVVGGDIRSTNGLSIVSGTSMSLFATGANSLQLFTNGTERLEIESDGAWQLGGNTGTAGQYARSSGNAAPPTWATISVGEVSGIVATTGAVTIPAGGGASLFSGIQNGGAATTDRQSLNFIGFTIADDAGNNRINITTPAVSIPVLDDGVSAGTATSLDFTSTATITASVSGSPLAVMQHSLASGAITNVHVNATADIEPSKIAHTVIIQSGTINAAPLAANDTAIQLNGTTTLNGISGGYAGREIDVYCATSGTLTANHASGSAAASDQIFLAGGIAYGPTARGGLRLRYDGVNSVWREVARADLSTRLLEVHSVFAADASISITPPADATWFEYEIKAGGGGGGGADAETDGESCAGGGGGEGEEARGIFTIVSGNVTGSIGGGGAGGSNAGGNGTNGTQTVLTYNATSVTCAPGNGGVGVTVGPALAGQLAFSAGGPGGNSGASTANHNFYGGADGTNGVMFGNPTTVGLAAAAGGNGGNGGRGAIVNGAASTGAGTAGKAPGSGGGGAAVHTQTTGAQTGAVGGNGVAGYMVVRFYSGPVPTRSVIS